MENAQRSIAGSATLEDVLSTAELARRPDRRPDTAAENAALLTLARQLTAAPEEMLDAFIRVALDLCRAGTAGVSILTTDAGGAPVFRWDALAGALSAHVGGTTPRDFSPCGITLDRGTPQLFDRPGRYFTYFAAVSPQIVEGLVVPFLTAERQLGTLWIVSHDPARRFDREDARIMTSLARFAATTVELTAAAENARRLTDERAGAEVVGRARDELLATVVHDLKTPLASVLGYSQVLRRRVTEHRVGRAEIDAAAQQIEHAATRMDQVLDDMGDLTRAQAGRPLALDRRPVDLVALARAVTAEHQQATDRHTVRLSTTEPVLVGAWDKGRLTRVIDNLLSNAVKFSPEGGDVLVEVRRDDTAEGGAVLTVVDRGMGIPPADLPRVFERFHRGENVADRVPGSGLGLASVQQLVEQHSGTVALTSNAGGGTTATVRLPLNPPAIGTDAGVPGRRERAASPEATRSMDAARPVSRRGHVLVVEDDLVLGDLVHAILVDEGYVVSLLGSARAGALRAAVDQAEPDCILLDGGGPAGYDASWAEAAWAHSRARPVPVVMFTTDAAATTEAQHGRSERSRDAGFAAVIAKPFDLDDLLATVERYAGSAAPIDHPPEALGARIAALAARLDAAGARAVRAGTRREWARFDALDGARVQLYRRERDGAYYVVRYAIPGHRFVLLGRVPDLDAAVALAVSPHE